MRTSIEKESLQDTLKKITELWHSCGILKRGGFMNHFMPSSFHKLIPYPPMTRYPYSGLHFFGPRFSSKLFSVSFHFRTWTCVPSVSRSSGHFAGITSMGRTILFHADHARYRLSGKFLHDINFFAPENFISKFVLGQFKNCDFNILGSSLQYLPLFQIL